MDEAAPADGPSAADVAYGEAVCQQDVEDGGAQVGREGVLAAVDPDRRQRGGSPQLWGPLA